MIVQSSQWHSFRTVFSAAATPLDPDGNRPWPTALTHVAGFESGVHGMTRNASMTIPVGTWRITNPYRVGVVNYSGNPSTPHVADAVPGVDEYDWWVSQRTSIAANEWLLVSQSLPTSPAPGATYSGAIRLAASPKFYTDMGLPTNVADPADLEIEPEVARILFNNVHVYVRRRIDGAIQWANVYPESLKD